MKFQYLTSLLVVCCAYSSASLGEELFLKCEGEGVYAVDETSYTTNNKNASGSSTTTSVRQQSTRGAIRFAMSEFGAKIKMPSAMLPTVFSREDRAGWLKVNDLKTNSSEIRGVIDLSTFSSADLYIDRKTGDITIEGYNRKYNGSCSKEITQDKDAKF